MLPLHKLGVMRRVIGSYCNSNIAIVYKNSIGSQHAACGASVFTRFAVFADGSYRTRDMVESLKESSPQQL